MAFFAFFGAMMIGGIVGYASEKTGFTQNGYIPSIIIALGGVVLFFMIRIMFGISFGPPGIDAIISAVGALILVPTHYRK
jgi:FtsH-binding integral membrane protein